MTPTLRVKFGLLAIGVLLTASLTWSAAQGQFRPPGFRPPGSIRGMNPPGGMGGGGIGIGWRCSKCGHVEAGAIPPSTCPGCGVRLANGVGNGSAGGVFGNPPGGPPMNGGFNPAQPPADNGIAPAFNPPDNPPFVADFPDPPPAASNNSPIGESQSPSRKWPIALAVGIIAAGACALLGGTFLVIYTLRNSNSSSDRRRRRRDGYDD